MCECNNKTAPQVIRPQTVTSQQFKTQRQTLGNADRKPPETRIVPYKVQR
jgi:hypothetical protein